MTPAKLGVRMVRYSFPVPLFHRRLHAGLARRTRILRSGSVSLPQAHEKHKILPKYFLPNRLPTRYNYLCPGYFLLAGFEVTTNWPLLG